MPDNHRAPSFPDLIVSTAREKHAAALARSGMPPHGAEPPRQVYMAALDRIAQALAPHGFRFTKSGPYLTRTDGPARYRIFFQSDRNNIAGEHVRFLIHAGVENTEAERWLAQSDWPFQARPQIGGGQIGNLVKPHGWWSWEIADPATREERIDDAIRQIEGIILPFFTRLSDLRSLADEATRLEISGVDDEAAVRLCYWQLGKAGAEQCLGFWVERFGLGHGFRAARDHVLGGGAFDDIIGGGVDRLGTIAGALGIGLDL
jgi:hypothetical protein